MPVFLSRSAVRNPVDLGSLLGRLYEQAGYDLVVDYGSEPVPPLSGSDAGWADALLRAAGTRGVE